MATATNNSGKVGIVTVTYNSALVIDPFIASTLAQTYPDFVLYIVDNASTDDTLSRIRKHVDPRIVIIDNPDNRGVAAGNNQGISAALEIGCDKIILINNDTEFIPSMVDALIHTQMQLSCDILVPKILYYDNQKVIWFAGGYFSRLRGYASLHFGQGEIDNGQYDHVRRIEYAPTCCMLIRDSVFHKIGDMDERYFVYFDDADFCLRADRAGLTMVFAPNVSVLHKVSSLTAGVNSAFTLRYSARNKLYFLRKHSNSLTWLTWVVLYQVYIVLRFLIRKDGLREFRLREASFREGIALIREVQKPRSPSHNHENYF